MSLPRKLIAVGLLGVLAAGMGWLWIWSMERKVRHHVFAEDRPE